ncbi:MAG: CapA family protein [Bacillota bacterium]|nr:CapA family protein [Bacillota bacterium]
MKKIPGLHKVRMGFALLLIVSMLLLGACTGTGASTSTPTEQASDASVAGTTAAGQAPDTTSPETTAAGTTAPETTAPPERHKVRFVGLGDNLIHPNLYAFADAAHGVEGDGKYDFTVFFEQIRPLLEEADLRFINQETISGGDELGLSGYPTFNSPRDLIYQLESLGFNFINLANNHSLDMGVRGIYHALYHWNRTDVTTAGIYADAEDRETIRVREVNGIRFALLSYTSHTNGIPADEPWRVGYMVEEEVRRDVARAKELADFVIVSAHWGWDDIFTIDDFQRNFAEIFADSGVDMVVGTGPHLLQHIEWIDRPDGSRMLCAFSLGNYASGMIGPFNELSGLLQATFVVEGERKSIEEVQMIPLVMHKEVADDKMGVYLLSEYTAEMAEKSAVNHYRGGLNLPYFRQILEEQIAPEFLPSEFRSR